MFYYTSSCLDQILTHPPFNIDDHNIELGRPSLESFTAGLLAATSLLCQNTPRRRRRLLMGKFSAHNGVGGRGSQMVQFE